MGAVNSRRIRWVLAGVGVVVAAGLVAGAATVWWRWDTRRRPHVDAVLAVMNRAVADVVTAAGDGAAVAVSPVVRSSACDLGPLRTGGIFTAKADLYADPGGEDALLTSVASRLPASYGVTRGPAVAGIRPLHANDGPSVTVAVARISPGWLEVTVRSRCSLGAARLPPPAAAGPAATALTGLLARLGTTPAAMTENEIACASGDIVTVSAVSRATDTANLASRLNAVVPAGARRFEPGDSNRVVYRQGNVAVIIAASDDGTAVTSQYTTLCG